MIPSIILCLGMEAFSIRHIACPGLLHIQEANMDRIRYVHLTVGNSHASAQRVHQLPGTAPICRLGDSALRLQHPVALAFQIAVYLAFELVGEHTAKLINVTARASKFKDNIGNIP